MKIVVTFRPSGLKFTLFAHVLHHYFFLCSVIASYMHIHAHLQYLQSTLGEKIKIFKPDIHADRHLSSQFLEVSSREIGQI